MPGTRVSTSQFGLPTNKRGAVFLLAVYFTALFLLVLSGVSLQRSTHEQRLSQIARDAQQAFWLAEAGLDRALDCTRDNQLTVAGCPAVSLANGTATPRWAALEGQVTSLETQVVTYDLSGTGAPAASSYTEQVSSRVDTTGPLQGIWAPGVIAVNLSEGAIAIDGSMYSGASSLVANVSDGTWAVQGIARTDALGTAADKLAAVEAGMSNEMRDLKAGFKFLNHVSTQTPKDTTGVEFIASDATGYAKSEYISGVLNVSFEDDVDGEVHTYCTGSLIPDLPNEDLIESMQDDLPGGELLGDGIIIEDGFRYHRKNHHALRDLHPNDGEVTLCVKAIVPNTTVGVANALLFNRPPKIIFRQPATVYVSGHETYDFKEEPHLAFPVTVMNAFSALGFEPMNHTNHVWDVTVAAELSAIDANGRPIPNGVKIIQRREGKENKTKAGLVNIKPGQFSGAIYTPHSLVVLRTRDEAAQGSEYHLQYVVGEEVAIDIAAGDTMHLGVKQTKGVVTAPTETTIQTWGD